MQALEADGLGGKKRDIFKVKSDVVSSRDRSVCVKHYLRQVCQKGKPCGWNPDKAAGPRSSLCSHQHRSAARSSVKGIDLCYSIRKSKHATLRFSDR